MTGSGPGRLVPRTGQGGAGPLRGRCTSPGVVDLRELRQRDEFAALGREVLGDRSLLEEAGEVVVRVEEPGRLVQELDRIRPHDAAGHVVAAFACASGESEKSMKARTEARSSSSFEGGVNQTSMKEFAPSSGRNGLIESRPFAAA